MHDICVSTRRALLVLLSLSMALVACPGGIPTTPPKDVTELVDRQVGTLVRLNQVVGASVAVIVDGNLSTYHFGKRGRWNNIPTDNATVYEVGSITKTFTSALLAQGVVAGRYSLDTPVVDLLPEGTIVPESPGREIQLGDLASHISGLPSSPWNLRPRLNDPFADYTMEQLYDFLAEHSLKAAPGERYLYSNLGVALLGIALANEEGMPYETLLTERLLEPLDLTDTTLEFTDEQRTRMAKPYDQTFLSPFAFPPQRGHNWDLGIFAPAGAIKSTLPDMIRYLQANMSPEGTVLESVAPFLYTERFAISDVFGVALGWHVSHLGDDSPDIIWHNGATGGYNAFMGFFRGTQTGVIILSNTVTSGQVEAAGLAILTSLDDLPLE